MIISIAGVSRSGKSALAKSLSNLISNQGKSCTIFSQDDYCLPEIEIPKIRERTDWEQPESMDWQQYHNQLTRSRDSNDVIIVEGLFVYDDTVLASQYDRSIYIELSEETFLRRRRLETRWGQEPEWFLQHVWEAYQSRVTIPENALILSGESEIDLEYILHRLDL